MNTKKLRRGNMPLSNITSTRIIFITPNLASSIRELDLMFHNPPPQIKHTMKANNGNHQVDKNSTAMASALLKIQMHMYDILARWNLLAEDLGIDRWVVHGGSAMGAKCFGGMNPWDDDIDMTVLDCKLLDYLWETGEQNVTKYYPNLDERSHSMDNWAALWDSRLIKVREHDMILSRGSRCCGWYKLMSMDLAFLWKPGDAIMGVELECISRGSSSREKNVMRASGWTKYLQGTKELVTLPFGSTTIKAMPPSLLNTYIRKRYGKQSPCQFPFSDGGDAEISALSDEINHTKTFQLDQQKAQMNFVLKNWYVPKFQREKWLKQKGDKNQLEYTKQLPNLDKIEIDNSISPNGCSWQSNSSSSSDAANIKVIGWNAERGTHWDKFYTMIQEKVELQKPMVILLNEMDVGMARSGNVHTVRQLAIQLGMNYAYGVEFLELTRGTQEEQEATKTQRDSLSLHGNAVLSKCVIGDGMILRDPLPAQYFSDRPERGINADGFEVRLGGRMGLFVRIFQHPSPLIPDLHNFRADKFDIPESLPDHFVVGNVHKVEENVNNRETLWNYFGFGAPAPNISIHEGNGVDLAASQHGVIVQGDFGPQFCSLGGLKKMNNYKIHQTFRVNCLPAGKVEILGPLSGDFFCSNMRASRAVEVTAPCDWSDAKKPLTMADHAIVSIEVASNKK
ncbi:hypothetical protein QTG54_004793 [Skeletonema marinoi]|uniref:Uncharacterized protein n=1 Tax=Skeletonema marinoi TaxID=267567 RepID=A0AAD8YFU9_9STRA|nr:hypothetical protein QTG54_004793 [Skeletonema marinoi]